MERNTHSLNWLALGAELIDCLKSKGNHRLTGYAAFVCMMKKKKKIPIRLIGLLLVPN